MTRIGVLAPLRHRDFRLLALGSLVSLLGNGVFRVTIAVQVLGAFGDPRALSLVAGVWAASMFFSLPIGGRTADRVDRRTLMVGAELARGAAIGVLAALSLAGVLQLWQLCLIGVVVGAGNGFFNPASLSLVPDLLPDVDLERANAFLGVARPLMLWIVGPLVGAAVVATGGPGAAFAVNAGTFLVSAVVLVGIARQPVAEAAGDQRGVVTALLADVGVGLRFVRTRRWAWAWIVAGGVSSLAHNGVFEVLLPTILFDELGLDEGAVSGTLAVTLAVGGAGSVLASTVLGQRGLPRRFMSTLFVFEGVALLIAAGYGLITARWQAVAIGAAVFSLFAMTEVIGNTLLQRLVPRRLLGRVTSLDWMTSIGLSPLGVALAGPLAVAVGTRATGVGLGVAAGAVILGLGLLAGARMPERIGRLAELRVDDHGAVHPVVPPAPTASTPPVSPWQPGSHPGSRPVS